MISNILEAADHVARMEEELIASARDHGDPPAVQPRRFVAGDRRTSTDSTTTSETPVRYLRRIRQSSIIAKSTHSFNSSDTIDTDSDSERCNRSCMPNKITGEMGVEIFLCQDGKEEIYLKYVADRHFQYIHSNVFAPAGLVNVRRMGGGGSGVSVFSGTHPELGDIVMKHGSFNDMKELNALASISADLTRRGKLGESTTTASASEAALSMKACLPEFKMIYISPQQLLYKQKAIWSRLKKLVRIGTDKNSGETVSSLTRKIEMTEHLKEKAKSTGITLDDSKFLGPGASIRIYECDTGKPLAYLEDAKRTSKAALAFIVPSDHTRSKEETTIALDCTEEFDSLQFLYESLSPLMSKHLFKFTLAQKRIGGPNAKTGAQWMYEGRLHGPILSNLITKFIQTVRNLQALTLTEEVDVANGVWKEVQFLRDSDMKSDGLSTMADQFMGNAIKKNFHPTKGRIKFLRKTCLDFQMGNLFLLPDEELPARHLATLGDPDAYMSDVFVNASSERPLFHPNKDFWVNLMIQATSNRSCRSPNATKRLWTSGLCDAGIHNLFVCEEELYFFDLGVPQLQSLPGFMTKFLFSFFHILGMQEDDSFNDNEWVNRFQSEGDKLDLTYETKQLLPKAYDAFEVSLNRIIEELFDGDQSLRWLLVEYVTLQLLSDASFCLQKWSMKGGGSTREDNNQGLQQWLWRALWDTYVAFDINTVESWERLHVEHPSCEGSNETIEHDLRIRIRKSNSSIDDDDMIDLMRIDELMDQIDEEEELNEGNTDVPISPPKNSLLNRSQYHSEAFIFESKHKKLPFTSPILRKTRLSLSASRMTQCTLRELTAATFEYKESDDSDDDSYDDLDSAELTVGGDNDYELFSPTRRRSSLHILAEEEG